MADRWFYWVDGPIVRAQCLVEGDDGLIGDAFAEIHPGETAPGLSYDALVAGGAGTIDFINGGTKVTLADGTVVEGDKVVNRGPRAIVDAEGRLIGMRPE